MPLDILQILEEQSVVEFLEKRNLIQQYKKAKKFILMGEFKQTKLKKRKPKSLSVWYFRINKQFRANAYLKEKKLYVYEIDNHQ